jgi:hypothetical protein
LLIETIGIKMPNKPKLHPFDEQLRQCFPIGMLTGTQIVIRKVIGFELFNTRPYHNYETWSDGYEVTDGKYLVRAEDLDDAMQLLMDLRTGKKEPKRWDYINENSMYSAIPFVKEDQE